MAKVLLIDDEIHVRSLMKYLIHWEELGLTLEGEYDNAQDAVAKMQQEPADIVITDICMPGMDGLEMIEQIQQSNQNCRFILISGYRDFEYAKKAIGLGVSEYIVKPINEEEINKTLRKVLTGAVKERREDAQTRELRQKLFPLLVRKGKNVEPDERHMDSGLWRMVTAVSYSWDSAIVVERMTHAGLSLSLQTLSGRTSGLIATKWKAFRCQI